MMSEYAGRPWALRAAIWFLGGWVLLSLWMGYTAATNFRLVKSLPAGEEVFVSFGEGIEREQALKYVASELNRALFASSERFQVLLGFAAVVLLVLARGAGKARLGVLSVCLLGTLLFHLALTPSMVEVGRRIDFIERDPAHPTEDERDFRGYHAVYMSAELAKLLALLGVAGSLLRGPRSTG